MEVSQQAPILRHRELEHVEAKMKSAVSNECLKLVFLLNFGASYDNQSLFGEFYTLFTQGF